LRKFLSKIHIWLGLLCAPYMIIFGFSSLNFNHHFGFVDAGQHTVSWERQIAVADTSDNKALAERVRLELGLMGWVPWWKYQRDEDNSFQYQVLRPAKQYTIQVNPQRTRVSVQELRNGPLNVINSLHALGHLPGSGMVKFWSWYTNVCVFFVVFAGVSGVYFWSRRKDETLIGWLLLAGVSGGSFLLMIFVWIRG
jgi:hypothetical protein